MHLRNLDNRWVLLAAVGLVLPVFSGCADGGQDSQASAEAVSAGEDSVCLTYASGRLQRFDRVVPPVAYGTANHGMSATRVPAGVQHRALVGEVLLGMSGASIQEYDVPRVMWLEAGSDGSMTTAGATGFVTVAFVASGASMNCNGSIQAGRLYAAPGAILNDCPQPTPIEDFSLADCAANTPSAEVYSRSRTTAVREGDTIVATVEDMGTYTNYSWTAERRQSRTDVFGDIRTQALPLIHQEPGRAVFQLVNLYPELPADQVEDRGTNIKLTASNPFPEFSRFLYSIK